MDEWCFSASRPCYFSIYFFVILLYGNCTVHRSCTFDTSFYKRPKTSFNYANNIHLLWCSVKRKKSIHFLQSAHDHAHKMNIRRWSIAEQTIRRYYNDSRWCSTRYTLFDDAADEYIFYRMIKSYTEIDLNTIPLFDSNFYCTISQ